MSDAAEARLRWLVAALQDPSDLSVADIKEGYRVPEDWHDFTPEREIDFLTNGPHAGSRPLTLGSITLGEERSATAVLDGADGKRFAVTVWSEDDEHITGARIVPAPPDGTTLRLATPEDGAALAELERRAPLRLGTDPLTFMTFDHGADYFGPARLMEEVTVYVAEYDSKIVGVYCGAVQPVEVAGETKRLFLEHHVRIDPEAPRGGVFWALCAYGRDRYARSTDSIAFYVSVDNHALRKFAAGTPGWSVQPLRALLPCGTGDGNNVGRIATAADADEIVAVLNGCNTGSALFTPYTRESLTARLARDASQYGWDSFVIGDGAVIGVSQELLGVTKECEGRVDASTRALVLDHGFLDGHEDAYRDLLRSVCARVADRGATHLAAFTSSRSSTFGVVSALACDIEVFDFWAFNIPEPSSALEEHGFYVDPVYF